jgi:hypothetical protein
MATFSSTVINDGSICVASNHVLGSWTIDGPAASDFAGSGLAGNYTGPPGSYSITAGALGGYNLAVAPPGAQNLPGGGNICWSLTYSIQQGNFTVNANIAAGSWTIRNSSGVVVAANSGTAPVAYNLNVGTYTITANPVAGYNGPPINPITKNVIQGANSDVVLNYSVPPLSAPAITSVNNAVCEEIRINWQDNSNTPPNNVETNFEIWRRDAAGGAPVRIRTAAANTTSYVDPSSNVAGTNPSFNRSYFYRVVAISNLPAGIGRTASSAESGPVLNRECRPDVHVYKRVSHIVVSPYGAANTSAYTSSSIINDTNVLRFEITIDNLGDAGAPISGVSDVLSGNLRQPPTGFFLNPWNLRIDKDGDGVYNELGTAYGTEIGFVSSAPPNLTINLLGGWGTKAPGNPNWVIRFDAQIQAQTESGFEFVSNNGCTSFTYRGTSFNPCGGTGNILFRTGRPRVPEFQEVNP